MTTKAEATKLTKTSHWNAETQMHSTGWRGQWRADAWWRH